MITIIYAHPYPSHSHSNRVLRDAVNNLPDVHIRSLYELYPDFHINVRAEQEALLQSHTIVLQHPPALVSHACAALAVDGKNPFIRVGIW